MNKLFKKKKPVVKIGDLNNKNLIQFVSDIHLEFYKKKDIDLNKWLIPSAPYLAILGDLGYPSQLIFKEFLKKVSEIYTAVFFVSGNHEYYDPTKKNMDEIDTMIEEIVGSFDNVYYLNNKEYEINHNYVILGTTLWSEIPEDYTKLVSSLIGDYNYIYINNKNVTPYEINNIYRQNVLWLENKLEEYKNKNIIILSHHLPSYSLVHKKFKGSPINCAFASKLDYLIMKYDNIKYWLCGHTHSYVRNIVNSCSCITNPYGYNEDHQIENAEFSKQKLIIM
jgi:predicted MPP superfamily phosphohydrolase